MTKDYRSLLIVGCDECASVVQVGGERQAETLKMLLEMARKLKGDELKAESLSITRQCDKGIVFSSLHQIIDKYEAILCLGCGAGVQTVADIFPDKIVLPATDTKFIGMHDREKSEFHEMCSACGECILHETGGICPITRCAKGLLNGPCGGQAGGKCEVGGWKRDCAWVQIYNRLKARGRLDLFRKFRPPRDFRISEHPREVVLEKVEGSKA